MALNYPECSYCDVTYNCFGTVKEEPFGSAKDSSGLVCTTTFTMQNGELVRSTSRYSVDLSAHDRNISHLLSFVSEAERYGFPTLFALSENGRPTDI